VVLRCGSRTLDLTHPVVMGVLNVTPDSFSDGGRFVDTAAAVEHALRMVEEGAAIIDVGGESTRPGALTVDADNEIRRVVPIIEKLRAQTDVVISVDTSKPQVMRAAAAVGAELINDVRALSEPGALEAAVATPCAVCLMHMQGNPQSMQLAPRYDDVVNEVRTFLQERVDVCGSAGLAADRLVVDPGFGFGKTLEHNLQLLRHLDRLVVRRPSAEEFPGTALPIMVGLSRKSTVGQLTGRPAGERVYGSIALAVIAMLNGARIVRVHDVGATVDALKTVIAVRQGERAASEGSNG
jgi:dihydropteroate synthase